MYALVAARTRRACFVAWVRATLEASRERVARDLLDTRIAANGSMLRMARACERLIVLASAASSEADRARDEARCLVRGVEAQARAEQAGAPPAAGAESSAFLFGDLSARDAPAGPALSQRSTAEGGWSAATLSPSPTGTRTAAARSANSKSHSRQRPRALRLSQTLADPELARFAANRERQDDDARRAAARSPEIMMTADGDDGIGAGGAKSARYPGFHEVGQVSPSPSLSPTASPPAFGSRRCVPPGNGPSASQDDARLRAELTCLREELTASAQLRWALESQIHDLGVRVSREKTDASAARIASRRSLQRGSLLALANERLRRRVVALEKERGEIRGELVRLGGEGFGDDDDDA